MKKTIHTHRRTHTPSTDRGAIRAAIKRNARNQAKRRSGLTVMADAFNKALA